MKNESKYTVANSEIYWVGGGPKKRATLLLPISSPIIDRFSKFFHWHTLQTICDKRLL